MSNAAYVALMAIMTATTVFTRSFFFMLGRSAHRMPPWLHQALSYVPAVALAAILAPDLLLSQQIWIAPWHNIRLLAAVAGTLFFLFTRQLLGTLIFGMLVYTALRFLL
jgi:hypothetical protein